LGRYENITIKKEKELAEDKRRVDLEALNKLMVGRELKMIGMKKKLEKLLTTQFPCVFLLGIRIDT
jgi:hypothetical protein